MNCLPDHEFTSLFSAPLASENINDTQNKVLFLPSIICEYRKQGIAWIVQNTTWALLQKVSSKVSETQDHLRRLVYESSTPSPLP